MGDASVISVAVITTSRADYSILRPLIRALADDPSFDAGLLVSGGHLDAASGGTIAEVEKDGFPILVKVPLGTRKDTAVSTSHQMANCIKGFADYFDQNQPDLLVALGDRYEMFAAVVASIPFNIPVAHIHGGELTYGAHDDNYRHALTKLSHLHFASTESYAQRITQMGEPAGRVYNVGALSLDSIKSTTTLSKSDLFDRFNISWEEPPLVVTLHPETRSTLPANIFAKTFFSSLSKVDRTVIITHPNADDGNAAIIKEAEAFKANYPKAFIVPNFGFQAYYSLLSYAAVMIGNSSSGIAEAQFFDLPVVNVGDRQKGRFRCANIIDVPLVEKEITKAIERSMSPAFRDQFQRLRNPYGDGTAARKITRILKSIKDPKSLVIKQFLDQRM